MILFVGLQTLSAQTKAISGKVVDDLGESIPGVSIIVKGTTSGTVTRPDGTYMLEVPADAQTLLFSFVGMKTQEVAIAGQSVINVTLASDAVNVDEVIVVAYGTSTKGSFTGSAAVVSAESLEKRQVSNVSKALAGSVAGVQVLSSNGQPGTSATVRIRGVGSINAGSNPLYVVDGIPFDGDLSSINSADIESMTVLKDAASTALYGARGANGIIMITTKKAKEGKATISFDAKVGINSRQVTNYDVLTSSKNYLETEYAAIYNAAYYNLGYTESAAYTYANQKITTDSEGGNGYQIYTLPDGENLIGSNGYLNPNATLGYTDGDYYYTPDDWSDETFDNNMREEYNLSMSGGNDKQKYYLSFGYLNDEGVISGSGFQRFSGRFNGDQELTDWLKVGTNINYNYIDSDYPGNQTTSYSTSSANAFFIANFIAPVYPVYVRDPETHEVMSSNGHTLYDYGDGSSTNMDRSFMAIANPVGDLAYNKDEYLMDIMNTSWYAELTPIQGLTVTARYGIHLDNTRYNSLNNAYMGQSSNYGGSAYQEQTRIYSFNQQYVANYQFAVGGEHQMDITAGFEDYSWSEEELWGYGTNLYDPESYYVSNAIDDIDAGGSADEYATEGLFARVNYSLRDTYFANVAYRRDASSRFSADNRWGNFYSGSAAWLISNEPFMADIYWINMLKLKASYGEQGNDDVDNYYAYSDQYTVSGSDGVFSDGTLDYKGNEDLSWETSVTYNLGTEFALLNNSLSGSIEYFGRKSKDMLYYKPVQGSVGYTSIPMNVGSMTNSGLEIDLGYTVLKTSNITWDVNVNATMIKNEINELHEDLNGLLIDGSRIYEEGESMYRYYLVEYAGVESSTGLALYYTEDDEGNRVTTTDWSDAASYKIGTEDLMPDVYGGFGTSISAFGFDASVQFSYQLGGQIYDSGYARLMHGGTSSYAGQNWHKDIYNAWTPDNTDTDVPRLNANDTYANYTSTRWITSSDYLSLNNITLGYTLPNNLAKKAYLSKVRVYLTAEAIALWSARKGLDPRQSYTSATTATYTPIRTVSAGINMVF
jgi:TonB-linked SusC/RagA family outer membrane protein